MDTYNTRTAATAAAEERNRELPDRADHRWIAHQAGEDRWELARVTVTAPGLRLPAADQARRGERGPERETPADLRPFIQRLIPPYGPN